MRKDWPVKGPPVLACQSWRRAGFQAGCPIAQNVKLERAPIH
jgi:hypothetical protein